MLSFITQLVLQFKYFGIFLGTFVEGPVVALLAGSLARIGIFSFLLVYLIHVVGDLSADLFYYFLGYQGQQKIFKKVNFFETNIEKAAKFKKIIHKHPKKVIILGKFTYIIGLPLLLSIGMSHYDWRKFLFFDTIATLIKSFILISLGYYLAGFFTNLNGLIFYVILFSVLFLIAVIIYFIIKRINRNLWKN